MGGTCPGGRPAASKPLNDVHASPSGLFLAVHPAWARRRATEVLLPPLIRGALPSQEQYRADDQGAAQDPHRGDRLPEQHRRQDHRTHRLDGGGDGGLHRADPVEALEEEQDRQDRTDHGDRQDGPPPRRRGRGMEAVERHDAGIGHGCGAGDDGGGGRRGDIGREPAAGQDVDGVDEGRQEAEEDAQGLAVDGLADDQHAARQGDAHRHDLEAGEGVPEDQAREDGDDGGIGVEQQRHQARRGILQGREEGEGLTGIAHGAHGQGHDQAPTPGRPEPLGQQEPPHQHGGRGEAEEQQGRDVHTRRVGHPGEDGHGGETYRGGQDIEGPGHLSSTGAHHFPLPTCSDRGSASSPRARAGGRRHRTGNPFPIPGSPPAGSGRAPAPRAPSGSRRRCSGTWAACPA